MMLTNNFVKVKIDRDKTGYGLNCYDYKTLEWVK